MTDIIAEAKKKAAETKAAGDAAVAAARSEVAKAKVAAIAEKAGIRRAIAAAPLGSVLVAFGAGAGAAIVARLLVSLLFGVKL